MESDVNAVPRCRIRRVEVRRLFGKYDHVIELNHDARVTVIHGPNGVGKTVLLNLVRAWLEWDVGYLLRARFGGIRLDTTDGVARVTQRAYLSSPERSDHETALVRYDFVGEEPLSPDLTMVGTLSADGVGVTPGPVPPAEQRQPVLMVDIDRLQNRNKVKRPRGPDPRRVVSVMEALQDLELRIDEAQLAYGHEAQLRDQSFPRRVLSGVSGVAPAGGLVQQIEYLNGKILDLQSMGILDQGPVESIPHGEQDPTKLAVMALYVEDTAAKLAVFDHLSSNLRVFFDAVNSRLRHKRLRLEDRRRLAAFDEDNVEIPLRALSSGEQHLIVLFYNLLFRVEPGTLVLMDEPELSLHISWQANFLDDLIRIAGIADIDILLATHSPYIAGGHTDLMVALDDDRDDR